MRIENPFHEGELQVQRQAGELEEGKRNGSVIADSIIRGALKFLPEQPMAVLGSVDAEDNLWASMLFGSPGFMHAPDDTTVEFNLSQAGVNAHDPFWTNIEGNTQIGLLIIELTTRRRLRINGEIKRLSDDHLTLSVVESFPNCPKYIQRREVAIDDIRATDTTPATVDGAELGNDQTELIGSSDTFFVASAHRDRGVDVSHRGGRPGFVEILDERTLRIPDYVGNSMFNTLGNFVVNPNAGLVFPDFDRGRTLQLTGEAEILWDQHDATNQTAGTRRFWSFHINRWRESTHPATVRSEFVDASPHNPQPQESPA